MDAASSSPLGREDGSQDTNQEDWRPRPKTVREADRVGEEQAEGDQCDDRECGPKSAPRAARATAFAPWPTRRRRCPGSVASAVSSVGAPKKTAGMKSKTAWLPAVARRKHESNRPIASGSEETSGTSRARTLVHAACVASTSAATLFTCSPGAKPVNA